MSGQSDDGRDGRGSSVAALAPAMHPSALVEQIGGRYADALGIVLRGGRSAEIHKWLVAAILFGARISGKIAARTYREFERAGVLSPRRMLDAGWDALVGMLDRGGYARYDFKTASKLLDVHRGLMQQYGGDLNKLHDSARDARDLEQRVRNLGKGIGDVTVNIFLRELRGIWPKAEPLPSARAVAAARALGFIPARMRDPARILQALKAAWRADRMPPERFADFEAALVRHQTGHRGKCAIRHPAANVLTENRQGS